MDTFPDLGSACLFWASPMNERFIVIGRWTYFPFGCASSCNVDIVAVVFHFSDKSLRNGRFIRQQTISKSISQANMKI